MDYRAIDFLNNFDEETRKHIIEFGKNISSKELEADVFLVMARKAICFVDFLCEVKLASLNGFVVSDRILDMNTEWLRDKTVTVIDDALVSGTTLKKVINKLEAACVKSVQVFVLSINKDWYNPEMLTNSNNTTYLAAPTNYNTNDKCMQMCYDIVKALSTIPKPYDIDFPLYGEYSIEELKLNEMLNTSWFAFNVTSSSHISNSYASKKNAPKRVISEYESITFIPPQNINEKLSILTGINWGNSCVLKIRTYVRKRIRKTEKYSISFLPFAIFNEISKENIDDIINHFFQTAEQKRIIEAEMLSYEAKFRLVQFIVAAFLMKIFFSDMDFIENESPTPIPIRIQYIFTPKIAELINNLINKNFTYTNTLSINSYYLDIQDNFKAVYSYSKNALSTYDLLSSKFMELYTKRELKARALAKKYGKEVFALTQYQEDMKRLEKGYTFQNLANFLEDCEERDFIVSLFLDFAIDTGIAVPITYSKDEKIVRAYRHGEDVIFTDVEAKQLIYMLNSFMEISARNEIPALLLEKLLTTFIRFGLHDSIFEKYDYKNIHSQERDYIKIAYYIHGTTAIVSDSRSLANSTPIITSDTKSIWLKDILVSKKLLKEKTGKTQELSAYYIEPSVAKKLMEEHKSLERGKIAKRIARVIGYLYTKKIINETDLVLLNASFGHDQIIPALLAEVRVILDAYSYFKFVVANNFEDWHSMNAIVSHRKSGLFYAQNSGYMKLKSYFDQEPKSIIEKVKNSNPGNFETEHFYDEFERYWNEKLSNVKEEIPEKIERIINLASVFILQYGLLFRTIELLIFQKHIGYKGVMTYFEKLKEEINLKQAQNRSEIVNAIKTYNEANRNSNIFPYFQIIDFEANSSTIKNDELIEDVANGVKLKKDIQNYIDHLKSFSVAGNLLKYKQAIEYADLVLNDSENINLNDIFSHLEHINNRAEEFIVDGCKYINNRGEIEAPVEYPNVIVISSNIESNNTEAIFSDIIKEIQKRQKKIKNDAELIYQNYNGHLIIMARGQKSDESMINLACHFETTLNYNNELNINIILNLNSTYSPYRFKSCVASANIITFEKWYDILKKEIDSLNSHFVVLSESDITIKSTLKEQLTLTKINSQPYGGLLEKEYQTMYLNKKSGNTLRSITKGLTIGVFCAKENERNGILESLKRNFNTELKEEFDKNENFRLVHTGNIEHCGLNHTIIVTKSEQGNTSAATAYSSLAHFKPDYVFFVGIAGTCNPQKIRLGDVILPSEIVDATLKKQKNDEYQLRGHSYRIPGNHKGLIQSFVRHINQKGYNFKLFESQIVSDNTVYACDNSEILKSVLTYNDKIDGIEMESAGLYSADYERNKTRYGVFTFRGVSDNANSVKDDNNHALAIYNASQAFCDFIVFISQNIDIIKAINKK